MIRALVYHNPLGMSPARAIVMSFDPEQAERRIVQLTSGCQSSVLIDHKSDITKVTH